MNAKRKRFFCSGVLKGHIKERSKIFRNIGVILHILFLLGILSGWISLGCLNPFAPKLTDQLEVGDLVVTQQKTPLEVLQNFKISYMFQDSLLYSNTIDTSFIFVYREGTTSEWVSWGREEDLVTTGRMFRHFNVIDLVWNETIDETLEESVSEISRGFNLTLTGEQSGYTISGRADFTFRKGNDEKWRISRWKDWSDI
ncbi:hypothetical protein HQ585_09810 [candidate division KSB1 bacterium]|nr:hypothetical protein [candidate division KSB1 bacterium]